MVVKVYVSRCSGNIEMKMKQDYIVRILESRKIDFEQIDISDQSQEKEKAFMREHSVVKVDQRVPLPPQVFSEKQYCGDYDGFLDANEDNALDEFLKLAPEKKVSVAEIKFTELPEDAGMKDGDYEEDTFDIDINKENMNMSTKKEELLDDNIEAAAIDSDEKQDSKKEVDGDHDAPSQSQHDSAVKDSNTSGDNKIVVLTSDSLEKAGEREDSGSLHDYENVVLTQDGDGNTVVELKEGGDGNTVVELKEGGDGNTVVELKEGGDGNTVVELKEGGDGNTLVELKEGGDGNTVVELKQDRDGNTVVELKEEADSGSLHDYENVVLTRDGEGNTVVQLKKDEKVEEEGKAGKSAQGENGAAAVTEVTSGGD